MSTYVLELRSTANWNDVRYREYTTSVRKVALFKTVPKVQFTDSGHGIVPVVHEHYGKRFPRIRHLSDHVAEHFDKHPRRKPSNGLKAENERLRAIEAAARVYYFNYCQDEASELDACIHPKQHAEAQALRDALALTSPSAQRPEGS